MGTKLKSMLIEQVTNFAAKNNYSYNHLTNINLSYNPKEKVYNVHLASPNKQALKRSQNGLDSESLNFQVDKTLVIKNVLDSLKHNNQEINENPKKIVIDFSSPNIAKPFHVGHLRSTIIGNFISNINSYYHNEVIRLNYLGDWGTQFGLLQYGINSKNITLNNLKENPIKLLYDIYVEVNKIASEDETVRNDAKKYFSDIEEGKSNLETWKAIREITIKELETVYERLGIKFDYYEWESDYNGKAINNILQQLENTKLLTTHESGKKIAKVNNRDVTVLKSDNSTLYLSRDIAALLNRYNKYKFDKMLYVVDNAQTDHFTALIDIVGRLNKECIRGCEHVKFGRIKGMSTRQGNVVFLNDILDEAKTKMVEQQLQSKNTRPTAINEETCDILGITAVLINDLKQRRTKDYEFDWNRALQSDGDSGIKLQYLHCRLWSLEQNSGAIIPDFCDPNFLDEDIIAVVVAELAKFDNVLKRACEEKEACIIVNYLFKLSRHVNRMFNEVKVKGSGEEQASQRLLVFYCVRKVLNTSLKILGVKPLYEM
ncbi:unnamed protein product [Pieris macdunnoughi]|uniref:Probable arginine--tRNA ligase, mitochondrial n=1 Tax=Pieris macdunnoughi TaxID=345717 RepID=A0A821XY88_9NEOP|nr:unnamed protein product [Pieris macdunnoughi]